MAAQPTAASGTWNTVAFLVSLSSFRRVFQMPVYRWRVALQFWLLIHPISIVINVMLRIYLKVIVVSTSSTPVRTILVINYLLISNDNRITS